jgi:hypothetical protein
MASVNASTPAAIALQARGLIIGFPWWMTDG